MTDLLPCPFCGQTPEAVNYGVLNSIGVRCENIQCSMHHAGFFTFEAWNTRPLEAALSESSEILKKMLIDEQQEVARLKNRFYDLRADRDRLQAEVERLKRIARTAKLAMSNYRGEILDVELADEITKRLQEALDDTN